VRLLSAVAVSTFSLWIGLVGMGVPRALGQSCVSVTTYHNDNFRTGQNLAETVLTPATVGTVTELFGTHPAMDGWAVGQPLYLAHATITINGVSSTHNVVFVATLGNSVYAFDGDRGVLYWHWHGALGPPDTAPYTTTYGCVDSGFGQNASGGAGIVGTPVIDTSITPPAIYFVTKEYDNNLTHNLYLHAVDTSTGNELSAPIALAGSVVNKAGTTITLASTVEWQMARPGLLLSNGTIYVGVGSVGCREHANYGWVMSYTFSPTSGFTQQGVFNTTPDLANPGGGMPFGNGGIWQGGGGLAADASGNVYFATADANNFYHNTKGWQGTDFGDSIVKLTPSLGPPTSPASYFTPYNDRALYNGDLDLASSGPVLLPDQPGAHTHILVGYGKAEEIYVIDRDNMGGYTGPNGPNNIVQDVLDPTTGQCSTGNTVFTKCSNLKGTCGWNPPVFWSNDSSGSGYLYFSSIPGPLLAYGWNPNSTAVPPTPLAACPTVEAGFSSGHYNSTGSPSVSANGTSGGLLWVVTWTGNHLGTLRAFDATNLASQLFQISVGSVGSYPTPTIANGTVYVAAKGRLYGFGIKGVSGCKGTAGVQSRANQAR
jgi:hypothetical protein